MDSLDILMLVFFILGTETIYIHEIQMLLHKLFPAYYVIYYRVLIFLEQCTINQKPKTELFRQLLLFLLLHSCSEILAKSLLAPQNICNPLKAFGLQKT